MFADRVVTIKEDINAFNMLDFENEIIPKNTDILITLEDERCCVFSLLKYNTVSKEYEPSGAYRCFKIAIKTT